MVIKQIICDDMDSMDMMMMMMMMEEINFTDSSFFSFRLGLGYN